LGLFLLCSANVPGNFSSFHALVCPTCPFPVVSLSHTVQPVTYRMDCHLSGFQSSFVASSESIFHCLTSGMAMSWSYRILIPHFLLFCVSKFILLFQAYTGIFKVCYFYP
jgi:hypothetical protein